MMCIVGAGPPLASERYFHIQMITCLCYMPEKLFFSYTETLREKGA